MATLPNIMNALNMMKPYCHTHAATGRSLPLLLLLQGSQSNSTSMGPPASDKHSEHKDRIHCICRLAGKFTILYSHLQTPLRCQIHWIWGSLGFTSDFSPFFPFLTILASPPFFFFFFLFFFRPFCPTPKKRNLLVDSHESPSSPPRGGLPVFTYLLSVHLQVSSTSSFPFSLDSIYSPTMPSCLSCGTCFSQPSLLFELPSFGI